MAMELGERDALLDAIHDACPAWNTCTASPDVLDEARAMRDTLSEGKTVGDADADAALRKAMELGELDALRDAIHERADTASRDVLGEARAMRDTLREEKLRPRAFSSMLTANSHRKRVKRTALQLSDVPPTDRLDTAASSPRSDKSSGGDAVGKQNTLPTPRPPPKNWGNGRARVLGAFECMFQGDIVPPDSPY